MSSRPGGRCSAELSTAATAVASGKPDLRRTRTRRYYEVVLQLPLVSVVDQVHATRSVILKGVVRRRMFLRVEFFMRISLCSLAFGSSRSDKPCCARAMTLRPFESLAGETTN